MNPNIVRLLRLPAFVLLFTGIAFVQLAPAQTDSSADEQASPEEEILELDPFTVTADQDTGYLAANTLAGSRFNTPLQDTPAAISVMTTEFLSDIGAFSVTEAMDYAINIERFEDDDRVPMNDNAIQTGYAEFRVRGMTGSTARNYFTWVIPTETALVERIEDSRGPNSVLFGIASPGGLINANTKQARLNRTIRSASFTMADHDGYRGTLDINQPLVQDRFAVRANLVYNSNKSFRHYAFEEHKRGHIAATLRLSDHTRIRAEYEGGRFDDNRPMRYHLRNGLTTWDSLGRPTFAATPSAAIRNANGITIHSAGAANPRVTYIGNTDSILSMRGTMLSTDTNHVLTDLSYGDLSINVGGPLQNRTNRFNAASIFFEHRFSNTSVMELAFNHQDSKFDMLRTVGSPELLVGDPAQFLPTGEPNPFVGQLFVEGFVGRNDRKDVSDTGRVTFSQELDADRWGNYRFAVMGEYERAFLGTNGYRQMWVDAATGAPAFNPTPDSGQNSAQRRFYVTEGDWRTYVFSGGGPLDLVGYTDPITGRTLSTGWATSSNPREQHLSKLATLVAGQARYFAGRLVLAGGLRWDRLHEYDKGMFIDPVTRMRMLAHDDADATTPPFRGEFSARTRNLGTVFHATPHLSLFANHSSNIELPARAQTTQPPEGVGLPIRVPPPEGESLDFGLAVTLLEGGLYARATYYDTAGKNQSRTGPNHRNRGISDIMESLLAHGLISQAEFDLRGREFGSRGLFDHEAQGTELEVTANATRNWRFRVSVAETKAVESNIYREWWALDQATQTLLEQLDAAHPNIDVFNLPTDRMGTIQGELDDIRFEGVSSLVEASRADGIGKLGNRRYRMNLFTRYDFSQGFLNGAYIGGGYRHQSKMFVGLDDDDRALYGNSYWYADLLAGYTLRLKDRRRIRFQFNVRNLFDNRDPLVLRYTDDHSTIFRWAIDPPRTWRFTTTFDL